jgi:UPF0288 family protein (methanogenesis marker protein 3)
MARAMEESARARALAMAMKRSEESARAMTMAKEGREQIARVVGMAMEGSEESARAMAMAMAMKGGEESARAINIAIVGAIARAIKELKEHKEHVRAMNRDKLITIALVDIIAGVGAGRVIGLGLGLRGVVGL